MLILIFYILLSPIYKSGGNYKYKNVLIEQSWTIMNIQHNNDNSSMFSLYLINSTWNKRSCIQFISRWLK